MEKQTNTPAYATGTKDRPRSKSSTDREKELKKHEKELLYFLEMGGYKRTARVSTPAKPRPSLISRLRDLNKIKYSLMSFIF